MSFPVRPWFRTPGWTPNHFLLMGMVGSCPRKPPPPFLELERGWVGVGGQAGAFVGLLEWVAIAFSIFLSIMLSNTVLHPASHLATGHDPDQPTLMKTNMYWLLTKVKHYVN